MKILFLNDDFFPEGRGGASTIILWLGRALINRGHQVVVVTVTLDKKNAGIDFVQGIKVYRLFSQKHGLLWLSYFSLINPSKLWALYKILKKEKSAIVHAHVINARAISFVSLWLVKLFGAKVFFTAHDVTTFSYGKLFFKAEDLSQINWRDENEFNYRVSWLNNFKRVGKAYNPLRKFFIRLFLRSTNKIFSVSQALKRALIQNKISHNIEVIYNGIDLETWGEVEEKKVAEFKNHYQLNDQHVIFWGGRLSMGKGFIQALEILKQLTTENQKIKLLIVGESEKLQQKFEKKIVADKLKDQLIFTGWLEEEEIKLAYAAADIILVPSICFDSFPTVNLEGMASRKPIIASCLGGSKEIILDQVTGYIVNPFETEDISEKISTLLKNKEQVKKFGQAGFLRIKEYFTLDKQVDQLLQFYTSN